MIAKAVRGTGFKALVAYAVYGHRWEVTPPEHRVAWIEARNLPTADAQAAAAIMHVTARDSERTKKPVYHLIISFDERDPVTRETMRRVADRTLRDVGLQDYQALIVAHADRAHPHLHIVVNRVHPERCTAWPGRNDYRELGKSMRAQGGRARLPGSARQARDRPRAGAAARRARARARTAGARGCRLSGPRQGTGGAAPDRRALLGGVGARSSRAWAVGADEGARDGGHGRRARGQGV